MSRPLQYLLYGFFLSSTGCNIRIFEVLLNGGEPFPPPQGQEGNDGNPGEQTTNNDAYDDCSNTDCLYIGDFGSFSGNNYANGDIDLHAHSYRCADPSASVASVDVFIDPNFRANFDYQFAPPQTDPLPQQAVDLAIQAGLTRWDSVVQAQLQIRNNPATPGSGANYAGWIDIKGLAQNYLIIF